MPDMHHYPQPLPDGTVYTCPIHPEIRHAGPGVCPQCGRVLEPMLNGADVIGRPV
ncbi:hypothetical protein I4X03_011920 [Massilia sp. R798]|uniref:Heavy metal binding domain-containing protein n=2 Tax=Massilia soli TaxID=2792854 RepID=A0ABS7SP96_9BURK|nr:hypothetical protein [Massilia soli]